MGMTTTRRRAREIITAAMLSLFAVLAIGLGIAFATGLGVADAAGQPLDVPAVSISPSPVQSAEPIPTAVPTPSFSPNDDDNPEIVTPPPPVTVELDDHGGERTVDDLQGDNSGHGNPED